VAVIVQPIERPLPWCDQLDPSALAPRGFTDADALLPYPPASFQGYRNLHEYFAFPERFLFVELRGLSPSLRRAASKELDIIILLPRRDPVLEQGLDASNFALFCIPAINLFPKRCDRIGLSEGVHEHHLIPDRVRPRDYEVYQVNSVTGYMQTNQESQAFLPFYAAHDLTSPGDHPAYYSLHRIPRRLSSRQRREEPRTSYVGSEVYLDLVDTDQTPYRSDLYQLGVTTLFCWAGPPGLPAAPRQKTAMTSCWMPWPGREMTGVCHPGRPWLEAETFFLTPSHKEKNFSRLSLVIREIFISARIPLWLGAFV